jgi:NADH:ubiquinone reductase (H+-translocating)
VAWSKKGTLAAVVAGAAGAIAGWKAWKRAAIRSRNGNIPADRKIVIVGAGFAGFNVARELAKQLPEERHGRITVVDQQNFLLFTPMLTELAGGELDGRHIVVPLRRLAPRIRFEQGVARDIDLANKSVVLDLGPDGKGRRTLRADQLVIALGAVSNYQSIAGVADHSLGIKSVTDAVAIRDRVLECLERANVEDDASVRAEHLTFVVAGGGYTGVETMAAINALARSRAEEYPNIRPDEITTMIIEPGERLLTELSSDLAGYAKHKLQQHGVQVLLGAEITGAGEDFVEIGGAKRIRSRTLIWAGGIKPNPLVERLDCRRGIHGRIVVDEHCAVLGHHGVWALGDCAEVPRPGAKKSFEPTAQNAVHEASVVARNIVAVLLGQQPRPFRYQPIGELALVGRHTGVAKLYGHHFSGVIAWAMWRAIYLSKMPGVAQRTRVLIDWILDFAFGRNTAELSNQGAILKRSRSPEPIS